MDEQKVLEMYDKGQSTIKIAEYFDTYPNKIRRLIKKRGRQTRDHSEAQKLALENGDAVHPTEGKVRSKKDRMKISRGMIKFWESIDEEEYKRRAAVSKDRWYGMTLEQREIIRSKGIAAIREAAEHGSKLERAVKSALEKSGYIVQSHRLLFPVENLEIDLYLPESKTIIEIDGPSHFFPIWGDDKLQTQINADLRKNGIILSKGYVIIRVRSVGQESLSKTEDIINQVLQLVCQIEREIPPVGSRFLEIE